MELKYNNSAGRLLLIFDMAKQRNKEDTTSNVWAEVFNFNIIDPGERIHPTNYSRIYTCLNAARQALDETAELISFQRPQDLHLYHRDFDKLKSVLSPSNLDAQWVVYKGQISDSGMMALEFCAKELAIEGTVEAMDLNALLVQVRELRTEVLNNGEMPQYLKLWIIRSLHAIEQSIEFYWISGGRKLKDALAQLSGSIIWAPQMQKDIQKHPTVADRFLGVFNQLVKLANQAKEIMPLIEYTGKAGELIDYVIKNIT